MSTATLRDYLVHVPDHPNALTARHNFNKEHNQDAVPLLKEGRVPFFGSTLGHHGGEGETPAENGTVMILKAESEEEVREIIRRDVFTKERVWDSENATIWPFLGKFSSK